MDINLYQKFVAKNLLKGEKWLIRNLPKGREGQLVFENLKGLLIIRLLSKVDSKHLSFEEQVVKIIYRQAKDIRAEYYRNKLLKHNFLSAFETLDNLDNREPTITYFINKEIEDRDLLRSIINRLDPIAVELLTLCFVDGYSYFEVAQKMGISEDAIKKRIQRIRQFIKRKIIHL